MPSWSLDARVPVTLLPDAAALAEALAAGGPPAAVLVEVPTPPSPPAGAVAVDGFDAWAPSHGGGCACCAGRSPAAEALDRMFQARVRGTVPWFVRVFAVGDAVACAAVEDALRDDALSAARFRLATP